MGLGLLQTPTHAHPAIALHRNQTTWDTERTEKQPRTGDDTPERGWVWEQDGGGIGWSTTIHHWSESLVYTNVSSRGRGHKAEREEGSLSGTGQDPMPASLTQAAQRAGCCHRGRLGTRIRQPAVITTHPRVTNQQLHLPPASQRAPASSVTGLRAFCKCGPVSPGLKWEFTLQWLQENASTGCTHTAHPKTCFCLCLPCRDACAPLSTQRISCRSANAITGQHVMYAMEASIHVHLCLHTRHAMYPQTFSCTCACMCR